jgi:RNA polymerase sigma-70 factor (ECF subfamily)
LVDSLNVGKADTDGSLKASGFTGLYRTYAGDVYRFALYLSGDPALAEDIVSETFLRIWDSATVVRRETVRGYLFTIARNVFLHDLRRARRQDPLEDNHAVSATAVRDLESREDLAHTLAALQTLPETDRSALLLYAREGVSYEEIARVLSLSLSAVKVKIHRARLFLAERRKGMVPCK